MLLRLLQWVGKTAVNLVWPKLLHHRVLCLRIRFLIVVLLWMVVLFLRERPLLNWGYAFQFLIYVFLSLFLLLFWLFLLNMNLKRFNNGWSWYDKNRNNSNNNGKILVPIFGSATSTKTVPHHNFFGSCRILNVLL